MAVFKCKMCGANLEVSESQSVVACSYCNTQQTLPKVDNERKLALFNRANNLRFKSEFDKASGIYESIIAEFSDEAEAYWGLVLCKYGIEYVDDKDGSKIPTCHRTLPTSIMRDADFQQACEYADITAKNIYREEAKVIDGIQKKILEIAATEEPYDIFICYKETDEVSGVRTEDSSIAQDIYIALTEMGYKVFYARNTLRKVAGAEYEPYIYAALSSAKVMIAIGTKYDYYDAVWVKNEWSRFISMMADNTSKVLIPCFKNMDAYDIPEEFSNMQALDMGDVMFFNSLETSVKRAFGFNKQRHEKPVDTSTIPQSRVQQSVNNNRSSYNPPQQPVVAPPRPLTAVPPPKKKNSLAPGIIGGVVSLILIVVFIVGFPIFQAVTKNARTKTCMANQREIVSQITNYCMMGDVPFEDSDEFILITNSAATNGTWSGDPEKVAFIEDMFMNTPFCPVADNQIKVTITILNLGEDNESFKITTECIAADDESHGVMGK